MAKIFKKLGNNALSEVVGTIFLILISVSLFSIVSFTLFSVDVKEEIPTLDIVASVDGNFLVLEHRGGESLSLDTKIMISSNGDLPTSLIIDEGTFLENSSKSNGKWDIGEIFKFPLENLSNFSRFSPVDVMVVDKHSNALVMKGKISESKIADVKIDIDVSKKEPTIGQNVKIYINVSNENGPSDVQNLSIKYLLPGSLTYINKDASKGTYNPDSGIWFIDNLSKDENASLKIIVKVESFGYSISFNQLAILLDGSGSIDTSSWNLAIQGLAEAISDEDVFPRNTVELTIVQFGVGYNLKCARLEVGPTVVRYNNYQDIANDILAMQHGQGWTPTAAGLYLTTDMMASSSNFGGFNPNNKQIVLLVTDGNANIYSSPGELCGSGTANIPLGQQAAEEAVDYMEEHLYMTDDQDEFDVIAVEPGPNHIPIDEEWLKDIVRPPPPFDSWPPDGPGWYHYVQDWQEFKDSIKYYFDILFRKIDSQVEIVDLSVMDPNSKNNFDIITIFPKSP